MAPEGDRPRRTIHGPLRASLLLVVGLLTGCEGGGEPGPQQWLQDLPEPVERDLAAIQETDTLRALLVYNSTSYFLYRGEAMGFEFRALRAFAAAHDMVLEPRVVRDRTELFRLLNEGEGDVVAARLVPVPEFQEVATLTRPLYRTRATVVQQEEPLDSTPIPDAYAREIDSTAGGQGVGPEPTVLRARLIRSASDLRGDTVHLPRGSEYYSRIVELADTLGGTMELVELDNALGYEALMRSVAAGSVQLAVTPENVAELTQEYFTNLVVEPAVGARHPVVWAVRQNAPVLRDSLNAWIDREEELLSSFYQTYFVDRAAYRERAESEYLTSETGRLSEYDPVLATHARQLGWDWRLLASQAFQESRFDPRARSWAGAMGLLQLMPATAREVGVRDPWDPEQNVAGAVRYIQWLEERWIDSFPDPDTRLPFVLASYNAGTGHVRDAARLTEKMGGDPRSWEDVSYWLLQLSKRQYYEDPVVRYGYVRGLEPVTYVSLILERFAHYREFVSGDPLAGDGEEAPTEAGNEGPEQGVGGASGGVPPEHPRNREP